MWYSLYAGKYREVVYPMDRSPSEAAGALLGALVGLARAVNGGFAQPTEDFYPLLFQGLGALDSDDGALLGRLTHRCHLLKATLAPDCALCASPCGRTADYDPALLRASPAPLREKKLAVVAALQALSGREVPGELLCEGLFLVGYAEDAETLEPVLQKLRQYLN